MEIGKNKNRIYIAAAIAVALLTLLWLVFRPAAVKVETAPVKRGPFIATVDAEGRTRVKNKYTVTAPVSGKMARINLNEGDTIPKDYPITEIDPNPPRPRPPSELENRLNPYAMTVYSPAAGKILLIPDKSERFLQAGAPLLEIGNPENIEVAVDVLSTDAVQVRPGSLILIDSDQSAEPMKARVRTIEPQAFTKVSALGVEEKRVDIVAEFVGPKPAFGDNYRVDCRIVTWQNDDVLSVPRSSLFRVGEDWWVFTVESGRARQRKVEIGHQSRTDAEVLGGLSGGDTVVLHPPNNLTDGSRVSGE
jgi:multidrug efflux pump subunit AcrA (membrane-fusion protein)